MNPLSVFIGPLRVDGVTQREALRVVGELIRRGDGGYVVTPNVDHIVLAHADRDLRAAYDGADLSLADGQPVVWMARLLGSPLPERVSGSDLLEPLMEEAARRRWRVYLFGARADVAAEAERRLRHRFPTLQIVGRDSSFWSTDDETPAEASAIVERIREAEADLVVVALGCPKQELWMMRHAAALRPAVAVGLGGSLDFLAGAVRRAPSWMSNVGLEWLYRLRQEPRRLAHRYIVRDAQIVPIFAAEMLRRLLPRPSVFGFGGGSA